MLRKIAWLAFLLMLRRSDKDVVMIYDLFSNLMKITTGGNFLNFGFWTDGITTPFQSQKNLTELIGQMSLFSFGHKILDVGSGYSIPAINWLSDYPGTQIYCINSNFEQLREANSSMYRSKEKIYSGFDLSAITDLNYRIHHINSISNLLPIKRNFFDRIIAFESAQHFKPFEVFIADCKKILKKDGLLLLAIPVVTASKKNIIQFLSLGILNITWASEHYTFKEIQDTLENNGFKIIEVKFIGSHVYQSLASYYFDNRTELKMKIAEEYSEFFEWILNKSIQRMKKASVDGKIEYVLIKSEIL